MIHGLVDRLTVRLPRLLSLSLLAQRFVAIHEAVPVGFRAFTLLGRHVVVIRDGARGLVEPLHGFLGGHLVYAGQDLLGRPLRLGGLHGSRSCDCGFCRLDGHGRAVGFHDLIVAVLLLFNVTGTFYHDGLKLKGLNYDTNF